MTLNTITLQPLITHVVTLDVHASAMERLKNFDSKISDHRTETPEDMESGYNKSRRDNNKRLKKNKDIDAVMRKEIDLATESCCYFRKFLKRRPS